MPAPVSAVVLPPGVCPPSTADERRLLAQSQQFESMLVSFLTRELAASARLAGGSSGALGMHAGMVSDSLADTVTAGGGIGIAGMVYGQLVERSRA